VQGFVQNEGDAWRYTLDVLAGYLERAAAGEPSQPPALSLSADSLLTLSERQPTPEVQAAIGSYLESVRLLGQRTAELHLALSADSEDPLFCPEPFTPFYQRSIYQSMRHLAMLAIKTLRSLHPSLPQEMQEDAAKVLAAETAVQDCLRPLLDRKLVTLRIRHHGDYHLGQVLRTGKDFIIIDFEGEPNRPLSERSLKRSPLRDVAGMLRSFHYASRAALFGKISGISMRPSDVAPLLAWAQSFCGWVSAVFLREYLSVAAAGSFLPKERADLQVLLSAFLIEKALLELQYELNHRPDWAAIPLDGILQLIGGRG
jgi:maltose alpha-D-glucosyltransferase/alpha-amylase